MNHHAVDVVNQPDGSVMDMMLDSETVVATDDGIILTEVVGAVATERADRAENGL